jgi:DNA-binding LytR/AlgR family response regulator
MTTEKINVLIVEDESVVALDLATALHQDGYEVIGIADHAEAAIRLFTCHAVDIVLMDIHLAGPKDGIDTVADLMKIRQTPVIYLTAFTDHATVERVKHTYPAAFLAKPYQISNVRIAIELALNSVADTPSNPRTTLPLLSSAGTPSIPPTELPLLVSAVPTASSTASCSVHLRVSANPPITREAGPTKEPILQMGDCVFVKYNYQFVKIRLADILFVQADSNHINLHTSDKKFVLRLSLSQLFDRLLFDRLIRIHRSYAVNIDAVQSFTEQTVLTGKGELPIGRNYKEDFLKRFNVR